MDPTETPRRRLPAAERRQGILDAALDVFADSGFHETSLDDVALRAGVSKALIYEHFTSKQALFDALLETYVGELMGRVLESVSFATEAEDRLLAGLDGFFAFVEERRGAWRLLIRHSAEAGVTSTFERMYEELADSIGSLMAEEMPASASPEGIDFNLAVAAMARQLLGSIRAMADWWDENRQITREQILAMVMEFAWLGMERVANGEIWLSSQQSS